MIVDRIETWLFDHAFPFWADVGVDRVGPGFVEHLDLVGRPAEVPFKRVRVQARQIYCFCQAGELGWKSGLPAAERAVELLIAKAWRGRDGGWAKTLTRAGDLLDPTPDLYDIAFVLFALAWWFRMSGDKRVPTLASETLDFLDRHLRHPSARGYWHSSGGSVPHLQNPHMHLTEAMLALRDATGQDRFACEADHLVQLSLEHFYDAGSGTLAEEFGDSWERIEGPRGIVLEPGHQYEWIWLFGEFLRGDARRSELKGIMAGLFDFAARFGQGTEGLVLEGVLADGTVIGPDFRLWPQAERLKAWLAMHELDGTDPRAAVERGVDLLFRYYLDTEPRGTWIEYRDPALQPKVDKIPTSSFYHLVLAFAEVLRFRRLFGAAA